MKMKISHYHITINDTTVEDIKKAASLVKGKVTEIDLLIDGSVMKDRMITKYQKGIDTDILFSDVDLLRSSGYKINRYKLEMLFNDFNEIDNVELSEKNYIECHIKAPVSFERRKYKMFALSSNRRDIGHYFYNGRCRSWNYFQEFYDTFNTIISDMSENNIDVHKEYTLYDSNPNHDSKWV